MIPVLREPTHLLDRFQDDFNNLFRSFGDRSLGIRDEDSNVITSQWMPPVDIQEGDNEFVIKADIPGVNRKDIEISMANGVLSIRGERKIEKNEEHNGYYRTECSHGIFHRRFSLPDSADPDKIVAKDKDGVLTITLSKRKTAKPTLINIQS
ncbi:MAG TPA: heat-shock protein Hsp20 [Porticoccaceae bacterium]|jgi:HSP20 family protein|nr:heat-shock protein Hsp20 [Porticoccaceae bacterium]